jgi:integrase/recombinase XerD
MKKLRKHIQEYLCMRYQLGFKLVNTTRVLNNFATYMEQNKAPHIITKLALAFAQKSACSPFYCAVKLRIIRRFALHLHTIDPLTEIPEDHLLPYSYRRHSPYIYSDADVLSLLDACKTLLSNHPLYAHTYYTLFGLIVVTGMRTAEVLALTHQSVDLSKGVITISESKFHKSRKIPIHATTIEMLSKYTRHRAKYFDKNQSPYFFVNSKGTKLNPSSVQRVFRQISIAAGLRNKSDSKGPRIMDFRHKFAVRALERCYDEGVNPNTVMPVLSMYLGHENPTNTYWYLTGTPELLTAINNHLERKGR